MEQMVLRCPVVIKSKVTTELKERLQKEVQVRLEQVEQELQQIEFQAKRLLTEQARIDAQGLISIRQQIEEQKERLMQMKAQLTAEQKQVEELEMGAEITRGQMEQTVTVQVGDDLNKFMGAEILLEDGKIIAFRN
ncbi:MAG: YlqD family protein [Veillonellaceae bacterium]|nr:YlqD family protein [Veillonellaceae bacterium]